MEQRGWIIIAGIVFADNDGSNTDWLEIFYAIVNNVVWNNVVDE